MSGTNQTIDLVDYLVDFGRPLQAEVTQPAIHLDGRLNKLAYLFCYANLYSEDEFTIGSLSVRASVQFAWARELLQWKSME